MPNSRQDAERNVLVRFWTLDHLERSSVEWSVTDWTKLVFAATGTLRVESNSQLWILPSSRGLWVKPGEKNQMMCFGPANVRTLYFHPSFEPLRTRGTIEISELLHSLIIETCLVGPLMRGNAIHEAMATLLRSQIEQAKTMPSGITMPFEPGVRSAAERFLDSPNSWSDLNKLAESAGYSRRTLERRFVEETGLSLGRWCREARMLEGIRCMSMGHSVSDAAFRAGYASTSSFIHTFKRHFGSTPGATSSAM